MTKGSYYNNNNGYESDRYRCDKIIERLEDKLYARNQQDVHEAALREAHPSLKNAWDHYQMLLKLAEGTDGD